MGHVYLACVSTVSIKTSKDNQLHEEAHAQHRPFQEAFKAIKREEAVCEARTTSGAQGERVQARPHLAEATRFYPARASSAGSGDRSSESACYLGNYDRSTEKSESQDFGHDDTKNKRDKRKLQLTDQKQKRVWRVQGKGVMNQMCSNHNSALKHQCPNV